jgi:hypothetical protein
VLLGAVFLIVSIECTAWFWLDLCVFDLWYVYLVKSSEFGFSWLCKEIFSVVDFHSGVNLIDEETNTFHFSLKITCGHGGFSEGCKWLTILGIKSLKLTTKIQKKIWTGPWKSAVFFGENDSLFKILGSSVLSLRVGPWPHHWAKKQPLKVLAYHEIMEICWGKKPPHQQPCGRRPMFCWCALNKMVPLTSVSHTWKLLLFALGANIIQPLIPEIQMILLPSLYTILY